MKKLLFVFVLFSIFSSAKTMFLAICDLDNTRAFEKYFEQVQFKSDDKLIILDSTNSQYIFVSKLNYRTVRLFSKNHNGGFLEYFDKEKNDYMKYKNEVMSERQELYLITKEKNDFSRTLKTVKNFIEANRDKYKNIRVLFFGNSYLHNAYGHNFKDGIPSDGFITMQNSEFNAFDDIDASDVKFAIFYDNEPYVSKEKLFRFYRKLFLKKFNSQLDSFNRNAVFDADKNFVYNNKPFLENEIKVVKEAKIDDCSEVDKVYKNYNPETAEIEIEIINSCKKGLYITFSHNGEKRQEIADNNGRVKVKFKALPGKNIIEYRNNNTYKKVFEESISNIKNEMKFETDFATGTVTIKGNNPLRKDGSQVEIWYENTGAMLQMDVKNGKFEKTVSIEVGKNRFIWKDLYGNEHKKIILFEPKCVDKVSVDKKYASEYGIAKVSLTNECRENGSMVTFYYKNKTYQSMVIDGNTELMIILQSDANDIFYKNFDREKKKLATINIHHFNDLVRFIITYKDNVLALMNIFEPNIKIDRNKPLKGIDYNKTKNFKEGHLHLANTISSKGQIVVSEIPNIKNYLSEKFIQNYLQIYVTRKSKIGQGKLNFYVDYFSRHGTYVNEPPLCGKRSLGGIVVDYEILENGTTESGKKFLNPSRCQKDIQNGGLKPSPDDSNLIFIKEVIVK